MLTDTSISAREEFRADQRNQFLAAITAASRDPAMLLSIETDPNGNTVAIIHRGDLSQGEETPAPSPEESFNAATLKLSVAIGTVDLFTQFMEAQEDEGPGHLITIPRTIVDALYGAIYHMRDAMDLLGKIPLKGLQS